jgi:hypothetical protein
MLIDPHKATLLVVDIQEKLIGAMSDPRALGPGRAGCWRPADLELPTVISEQYPKGLGHTLAELIAVAPAAEVVEKPTFPAWPPSACRPA